MTTGRVADEPVASGSAALRRYPMLIGGEWVDARSGATLEPVNPFTGQAWAETPRAGPEDVDAAVRAARAAFDDGPWRRLTGTDRARLMRRLGRAQRRHARPVQAGLRLLCRSLTTLEGLAPRDGRWYRG
ncbi:MAG: carnitine dehydratase [Solirubrobacterales bacterium]|jgi:hypothetical protein|nr:carnitine dehydratase [Solirubrobacterales bacterium]